MEDGWIFLKNHCNTSFNKDLPNEPTFGLIHLAWTVPLKWILGSSDNIQNYLFYHKDHIYSLLKL
jgi:hypothetical protein